MGYLPEEIQSKILSYIPCEAVQECKLVSKTWNSLLSHRKTAKAGLLVSGDNASWRPDVELRFGYYDEILCLTRVQGRGFCNYEIPRYRVQERSYFDRSRDKDRDDNGCLYKKLTEINVRRSLRNVPMDMMSNLIGSCNGLVCLFVRHDGAPIFHIFNPFTGEFFDLPTTYKIDDYMVMGFGYNASSSNYKVVRILYPGIQKDQNKGLIQIYTLGGDSSGWRNIGEVSCILQSNGILWNGSIYWLARDSNLQESSQWKIAAFDLADEEFRYLPIPALGHSFYSWPQLTLLGRYLSSFDTDATYRRTYIWSFKKKQNDDFAVEEGYHSSWDWILEFTIPFFPIHVDDDDYFEDGPKQDSYEPIGLTKNNEVFLWYRKRRSAGGCKPIILCRYDPKTDSLIKVMRWGHRDVTAFPHVNSFVSLKDMGVDSKTIGFAAECGCMEATTCAVDCACGTACAADGAENKLQI